VIINDTCTAQDSTATSYHQLCDAAASGMPGMGLGLRPRKMSLNSHCETVGVQTVQESGVHCAEIFKF